MSINFNFPILKSELNNHLKIKHDVLRAIENQHNESLVQFDEYYSDSISKLDWNMRKNHEREWVKIVVADLYFNFEKQMNKVGLKGVQIKDLWFQQYTKGDNHGWHVHGENFTGVYYLELGQTSPKTELIEPLSKRKITVEAFEGDVVIFPSVYIHRAPKVQSDERKTIISFNFSVEYLEENYLKEIMRLHN